MSHRRPTSGFLTASITLTVSLMLVVGIATGASAKPNIVVVVADDVGYGDLSSYGGAIRTPNLDALADQGVRFTDFHSNGSLCSPTRAALMTGRYPQRTGIHTALSASDKRGLDTKTVTTAKLLKAAGYRTGLVGKWHLGHLSKFHPTRQGFDFFYGFLRGEIDYFSHVDSLGGIDWWRNTTLVREQVYSTTAITREAVSFIQRSAASPFFLYVAYQAAHAPYQAPEDQALRTPGTPKGSDKGDRAAYPAMVQAMDRGIGDIVNVLRTLNLDTDTFFLFLSDNGAHGAGSNGPLRGGKGQVYEGGHRVPAIASWPGRVAPATLSDTLATIDVLPTILDFAEVPLPHGHHIDGETFAPLLLNRQPVSRRQLFWMQNGNRAVRHGDWKLTIVDGKTSLFDVRRDLAEKSDVAASYPAVVEGMSGALRAWTADVASSR